MGYDASPSVKAFSFLDRIRYEARPAGTKDAVWHDEFAMIPHPTMQKAVIMGQPWTPATV
jgi:hypothetical protein